MIDKANAKMVKIVVDGKEHMAPAGANLLEVLLQFGRDDERYPDQRDHGPHYVPHYCWHPGLTVAGNCRMCFINMTTEMKRGDKVEKVTTPTTACTNVVREGLEIDTKSAKVKDTQNGVQEFLLINHPLDCPECDKSGECRLQDYAFDFGRDYSRYDEKKVGSHIKQLGPNIDFFGTRCIQCSRCIRFSDEVSGTSELCFVNRGDRTTIDTFPTIPIDNRLDLNVVELCPVGALKNHDFLYQARVWNLEENESVCNLCSKGCNMRYDSLRGVVKRTMALENRGVNDFWICNDGRLNFEWINRADRLLQPRDKQGSDLSWSDAYVSTIERLRSHMDKNPGEIGVVLNCSQTVEELYLMRTLFKEKLGVTRFAAIARPAGKAETFKHFEIEADKNPNRRGVELVFGITDADASIKDMVSALNGGKVKTLVVVNNSWDSYVPAELKAATSKAGFVVGFALFNDDFCKSCDIVFATQTHAEKDGSYINSKWRLQAFRKAVPDVGGLSDTEVLQELLDRLSPDDAPVQIQSAAGVFKSATSAIPQLSGYSHRDLIRSGGATLM
ncbi:MAG: 2Fe-2S iron-sulfur cluster-binding protein [Planctomycetes bacterium]|nr:2Fe-2S iron-sulfur cluster-binding protein [Planctomycetota bacterium]NUQ35663.1 (2Fe-2S)-binding protein [Planctomycetaceae bacterium]